MHDWDWAFMVVFLIFGGGFGCSPGCRCSWCDRIPWGGSLVLAKGAATSPARHGK